MHAAGTRRGPLTGCSEEGVHQLVAVLANRVGQAAGRHGGSVLERELFGSFDFLVGFVLPLGFQHALEVQARRHVCRRTRNTKHGAHVSQMMPQKHHHCPPVPKKHSRLSLHGPGLPSSGSRRTCNIRTQLFQPAALGEEHVIAAFTAQVHPGRGTRPLSGEPRVSTTSRHLVCPRFVLLSQI